jgi:ubiquinone/menaquinone biosynthesis C-methylase UbiE
VYGVDPDPTLIALARQATPPRLRGKIRFRQGTAERPGIAGRRFDVALFSGSL